MEPLANSVQTPQEARLAPGATLPTAECPCGCGRPPRPGGKYADPEACRRQVYARLHPTFDLSGLQPSVADRAKKLAEEAIVAAKLGQRRATVDLGGVKHEAAEATPDQRPSNRIRLDAEDWERLERVRLYFDSPTKTSAVRLMIARVIAHIDEEARHRG